MAVYLLVIKTCTIGWFFSYFSIILFRVPLCSRLSKGKWHKGTVKKGQDKKGNYTKGHDKKGHDKKGQDKKGHDKKGNDTTGRKNPPIKDCFIFELSLNALLDLSIKYFQCN